MSYPASLDDFTAKVNNVDDVMAVDVNELQTAIEAIETELGTDPAGSTTDLKTRLAHSINDAGMLEFDAAGALTIATGAVTVTQNFHKIDTESGAASDDLDTINGGTAGLFVIFRLNNAAHDVVFKHGTGNISCVGGADITLTTATHFAFGFYDAALSNWFIAMAAGVGSSTAATLDLSQSSTSGAIPVLKLTQADVDDAFIQFSGNSTSLQNKSISTLNGTGAVEGPKNYAGASGWAFVGMAQMKFNSTAYWVPFYRTDHA